MIISILSRIFWFCTEEFLQRCLKKHSKWIDERAPQHLIFHTNWDPNGPQLVPSLVKKLDSYHSLNYRYMDIDSTSQLLLMDGSMFDDCT